MRTLMQPIEIPMILVWCIQSVPLPPQTSAPTSLISQPVWSTDRCSFYLLHCAVKQMNAGWLNVWMPSEMLLSNEINSSQGLRRSDRCGNLLKPLRKLFEFGLYRFAIFLSILVGCFWLSWSFMETLFIVLFVYTNVQGPSCHPSS